MLNPRQRLRPRLPLVGDAPAFRQDLLAALARGRYEQGDVARYRLGPVSVYGVSSAETCERVLTDSETFGKLGPDNPLRLALGDGLLTRSDHDSWLRNRRMVAPAYHRRRIEAMYATMLGCVEEMLGRWDERVAPGAVIDLHTELMHVTLDIVSRCMFSVPMLTEDSALRPDAVEYAVTYTFLRLQNPAAPPTWVPTPANRRFAKIVAGLDALMATMISERRRVLADGNEGPEDLLDMLIRATDADTGEQMSDAELRDEIITTLAAGHETTAITLTWAFYLLSTHPQWRARVLAEIDDTVGGRVPTAADLPRLPLVAQVFDEALRLFPSSPTVPRQTRRPVRLGGFDLPVGSRVLVDVAGLHRNRRHWPDPDTFDPSRFEPGSSSTRNRWTYLPFGGGPHLCVGKQFALQEARLLLAAILGRYDVRHHPGYPVDDRATITLRPRYGLRVVLHPRTGLDATHTDPLTKAA